MTRVVLEAKGSWKETRERNPDDEWDRGDSYTDWAIKGVKLAREKAYDVYDTEEEFKAGDVYYAVVAVWSDGDSFGHDQNRCCGLFGVYHSAEDADKREHQLRNDKSYSILWNDYFESLSYIEIVSGVIT